MSKKIILSKKNQKFLKNLFFNLALFILHNY
jgi:hypothetical protein